MKFHPPKQVGIDQDKFDIYKDVINAAYRFQDMMLGRKLQLIDDDTTVLVMSDHGYESGSRRIMEMPKLNAAPALEHRNFGMFAAMGPNIKKNTKLSFLDELCLFSFTHLHCLFYLFPAIICIYHRYLLYLFQ